LFEKEIALFILQVNTQEMEKSILARVDASVICLVLFILMLFTISLGNKMRKKFWNLEEGDTMGGVNSLLAALFGLYSFILAFTFSQSGSRFDNVRAMMVEEANCLRTTIIRADLFPDSTRTGYRADLRKYLDIRIGYYDGDEAKAKKNDEDIAKTASALWARTVEQSHNQALTIQANNMATSLTSLFDIGSKREALLSAGIPHPISYLLIVLALAICLLGGFTTPTIKRKEWVVVAVFAFFATTILYITIDLARPMEGFIKPDTGQATILNLRKLF